MKPKMIRYTAFLLMAYIAFTVSGCATLSETRNRGEENLRERVQAYYALKMEGNFFKAFEYENMSLDGQVERAAYAKSNVGTFKSVQISEISINGDAALIKIHSVIPPPQIAGFERFNPIDYDFEDKWVFKNSNWYHIKTGMMGKEY